METINHESYVSLDVAKLLKKAGFDWKVISYYRNGNDRIHFGEEPIDWNRQHSHLTIANDYSAPALEVAQRWLREVKGILLYITPKRVNMEWKWDFWYIDLRDKTNIEQRYSTKNFNTYEEAQEAGIKKTLEMILENVE